MGPAVCTFQTNDPSQNPQTTTDGWPIASPIASFGAYADGAPVGRAVFRVTHWENLAMPFTAEVGAMFGATV